MAERIPLYPLSRKESQRLGEHELWLDSYQENCACARSIELAIKDAYAANRLNAECARVIIKKYGFDRVNWVLAHTIQNGDNDIALYLIPSGVVNWPSPVTLRRLSSTSGLQ